MLPHIHTHTRQAATVKRSHSYVMNPWYWLVFSLCYFLSNSTNAGKTPTNPGAPFPEGFKHSNWPLWPAPYVSLFANIWSTLITSRHILRQGGVRLNQSAAYSPVVIQMHYQKNMTHWKPIKSSLLAAKNPVAASYHLLSCWLEMQHTSICTKKIPVTHYLSTDSSNPSICNRWVVDNRSSILQCARSH